MVTVESVVVWRGPMPRRTRRGAIESPIRYVQDWKHNGYCFFDSPAVIREVARAHGIDVEEMRLFYYEMHALEFDDTDRAWRPFEPEPSFATDVLVPRVKTIEGFDVVTYSCGTVAECSPLSCNGVAKEVDVNRHCLLASLDDARRLLDQGAFDGTEPGPFRILAVHSTAW